ncbi:hypothetical protein [Flavobacterium frigidarium]|uniref:JmjC domain-containing protein n=1 Tax=Flavobacterium frigidarium TaxID=99286 RepID=A0ABV4KDB7_9FLAO
MNENLNSFDNHFWEKFLKENENFTQTCVMKNAISDDLVDTLNKGVMEVLIERFKLDQIGRGFRVYLDGKEQDDAYLKNLCKTIPELDENIIEYSKRVFNTKFGIIINSGEKHSDIISERIMNLMQPLIEKIGLPASGLEITIFIGDYGWTPLGIHQDHRGENVMHFHLGPGKKTMYTWDEKVYEEVAGSKFNNRDIEPILKHSNEYPFTTGDLYYMPWNKYHVGFSDELSVAITLWFNNPTKQTYVHKIIESFIFQYVQEDKDILTPQINYLQNNNTFSDILSTIKLDEDVLNLSTKEFLNKVYSEYKFCLLSNGGWQSVPLSREMKDKYDVNEYEYLLDKKVFAKKPFKLFYTIKNEIIDVYVRGSKIEMKHHKELELIIGKINTNEVYYVNLLLENLSKYWPIEAGLYFISLLYDKRGIEII